ncbi:MerR family DNA-binding transcriptional regulator [Orrella sp. NBD-18]|uniref:MerR family DNA-binding transcriptional regulator n=1 Tax=Sheuella amnicola TaxID=2707330 RepID=A0A6B2R1A8_9BURK|nr:MerR family DNA-binding transcriptional regulator [Sheuella amnicola]NDY84101.1 MerR family DNA-binding transcriptional regulator [Sheuella amnicola]HBI83170.1 MerR family transcriptional regulator [Alcaligenaceae bacterium]
MPADSTKKKNSSKFTIADLATEFDVTHRAIRFYEDQGLLAPERVGKNSQVRMYSGSDRTRLKLILRGKRLGFSLAEIKEILDINLYNKPGGSILQLERFIETLAKHRHALEQQMEDLKVLLDELSSHEMQCKKLLADKKAG